MKWLYQLADAANALLLTLTGIAATLMMIGGLYALNDIYYTNRTAFVSYDLLQYRPTAQSSERKDVRTFTEHREINQDTVGWLELFDTHINYPVVQGNDNFEYLNKDIFGYSTLSGSIYLAAENSSGFDDWYNIVYGHHMDNGAMFSDIEKFLDAEYFASHSDGILQTETGDYKIKTIACIRTNAYEDIVYQVQDSAEIPTANALSATGAWDSVTNQPGGITFTFKHGDVFNLIGLPEGTKIKVCETNDTNDIYAVSMVSNGDTSLDLVKHGSDTIGKSISAELGDAVHMNEACKACYFDNNNHHNCKTRYFDNNHNNCKNRYFNNDHHV